MTRAGGRRFGLTVGGAFLALAAVAWWREHPLAASVLAMIGGGLAAAGLLVPDRLGPVERAWMSLAHTISRVTTPVALAAIFLIVLMPVGILRRILGGNPLVHTDHEGSFWKERREGERRSRSMRRQF